MARWVYELGSVTASTPEESQDSHERSLYANISESIGLTTPTGVVQEGLLKSSHMYLSVGTHSSVVFKNTGSHLSGVPGAVIPQLTISSDDATIQNIQINNLVFDTDITGGRIFDCEIDKITFNRLITTSDLIFENCVIKEIEFNAGGPVDLEANMTSLIRTIFKACQFTATMPTTPIIPKAITLPYIAEVMFDTCIFSRPLWIGRLSVVNITSCCFNFNIEFVVNTGLVPGGSLQVVQSRFGPIGNIPSTTLSGAIVNHPALGAVTAVQAAGNYVMGGFPFNNSTVQWEIVT